MSEQNVTSATSEWGETIRRGVSEKGEGRRENAGICDSALFIGKVISLGLLQSSEVQS